MSAGSSVIGSGAVGSGTVGGRVLLVSGGTASIRVVVTKTSLVLVVGGSVVVVVCGAVVGLVVAVGFNGGNGRMLVGKIVVT